MTENEQHLKEILKILQNEGLLNDLVLIGSWSLLFYSEVFLNFKPSIRTTDVDFYVPDAEHIVCKGEIVQSLRAINYDLVHDILTNKSRFISPDGFELEFLTRLGRNRLPWSLGNAK